MEKAPDTAKPRLQAEGNVLQAMVAHWVHEDALYWAQVRHLLILQLAVFGSWFTLFGTGLSILIPVLGLLVSYYLYRLARRIAKNRDSNVKAIRIVARNAVSVETEAKIAASLSVEERSNGLFRFADHELNTVRDAGHQFQRWIFGLCMSVDALIAIVAAVRLITCAPFLTWLHTNFTGGASCL